MGEAGGLNDQHHLCSLHSAAKVAVGGLGSQGIPAWQHMLRSCLCERGLWCAAAIRHTLPHVFTGLVPAKLCVLPSRMQTLGVLTVPCCCCCCVGDVSLSPRLAARTQIQGMHTILRDVKTPKNDFTFFADRLNRLVRACPSMLVMRTCCFVEIVCCAMLCCAGGRGGAGVAAVQ